MQDLTVTVKGSLAPDLLIYLEDAMLEENSIYASVEIEEDKDYGHGNLGGAVEILAITLSRITAGLIKELIMGYLKDRVFKKKVHAATYKIKNDEGEELTLQLNGLSLEEVEDMIKKFRGKIVEVAASE